MTAYPVLLLDQTAMPAGRAAREVAASAMTYKFVGVLRSLTDDKPYQRTAIWVGIAIGFVDRGRCASSSRRNAGYQRFVGRAAAPASRPTSCSTAVVAALALRVVVRRLRRTCTRRSGSAAAACSSSVVNTLPEARSRRAATALPEDMSTDVARRRRPHRRRLARGARARHRRAARDRARLTPPPGPAGKQWRSGARTCRRHCGTPAAIRR